MRLSIIIPCYNEAFILPKTIEYLEKFCFRHRKLFVCELMFVNDGSRDHTMHILDDYAKGNPNITIISYPFNLGKGYAVRQGLIESKHDIKLILDADLSVKPDEILKHLDALKGIEPFIITGQRVQVIKQPLYRRIAGKCFQMLHMLIFDFDFVDTQCPFKVLYKLPKKFAYELKIEGFAYDCELLYKVKKEGYKIITPNVEYNNEPDSRVTLSKTIKMFFDMFRIKLH